MNTSEADTRVHHYGATCTWSGSTGEGYDKYDRSHRVGAPPAEQTLTLSSDPAFRGDPARLNPEQLLVMAAASCQLLAFLAIAARSRLDVIEYEDQAAAKMSEAERPIRLGKIQLRPRIVLTAAPGSDTATASERVRQIVQKAHHECYIANSLKTEVSVEPTIEWR